MSKKEKKNVLTEKVMTVAQKIASFFFNRAEDNVVAPHLSISSHRVLVMLFPCLLIILIIYHFIRWIRIGIFIYFPMLVKWIGLVIRLVYYIIVVILI